MVSHQPDMSRPPPGCLPSGERMGPAGGAMPPPPPSTGGSHLPLQEYPDQKVGEGDFNPGLTAEDPATRGQIGSQQHTGLTQLDPPPPGAIPSTADQPEEGRLVRVGNMLQIVTDPTATPPKSSASTAAIVGVPAPVGSTPNAVAGGGTKNDPTTSKLEEESVQNRVAEMKMAEAKRQAEKKLKREQRMMKIMQQQQQQQQQLEATDQQQLGGGGSEEPPQAG